MKGGNILEYKGYHTRVEYDAESNSLRGKIEGILDYIDFECSDLNAVEEEFHAAVDDYLDFCEEVGKTPEKEYKGSFNVRISPDLHKKAAVRALIDNCSLNNVVEMAIASYVDNEKDNNFNPTASKQEPTKIIRMESTYENETTVKGSNIVSFTDIKYAYDDEVRMQ